jgi:hypothetical protein
LLGFYRKRAKASGYRDGSTGTVTVIQRFGGALNLNVHFPVAVAEETFVVTICCAGADSLGCDYVGRIFCFLDLFDLWRKTERIRCGECSVRANSARHRIRDRAYRLILVGELNPGDLACRLLSS